MCLNTVDGKTLAVDRMYKVVKAASEDGEYEGMLRPARFKVGVTSRDDADSYIRDEWNRSERTYRTGYHGWVHRSHALLDRQDGEVVLECAVSDVVASGGHALFYNPRHGHFLIMPCVVARTITPLREVGEDDSGGGCQC